MGVCIYTELMGGRSGQAVCVLGMHRSGTSMVTELLSACGVYVGDDAKLLPAVQDDNPHGYFEHAGFFEINEEILRIFGGDWENPPVLPEGWTADPKVLALNARAVELIREMGSHAFWAWKDPRTCLTLPFWQPLVGRAKYILCVRHPLEVAQSFAGRRNGQLTREKALSLWEIYNQAALTNSFGEDVLTVNYVSFQYDAAAELQRVVSFLGLEVNESELAAAAVKVDAGLWHGFVQSDEASELYQLLCAQCGPVFERQAVDQAFQGGQEESQLAKALQKIEKLEALNNQRYHELIELRRTVEALTARLGKGQKLLWRISQKVRRMLTRP
ncbi:hypothetical protein BH11ARM1_BH11ARM1_05060 [soil metagenome]